MGVMKDVIGFSEARHLSKIILLISAIAISTFSMTGLLSKILNFELGLEVRNIVALSLVIVVLLIQDDLLNPRVPFLNDKNISKIIFYVILGLIAVSISTLQFKIFEDLLNIAILDSELLTIRNVIAVMLLFSVRTIHIRG